MKIHPDSISDSVSDSNKQNQPVYRVYKTRWLVISIVSLLAMTNAIQWIFYSTIKSSTNNFYGNISDINSTARGLFKPEFITTQLFQCSPAFLGLYIIYISDKYDIRLSLTCGAILNFVGSIIRLISACPLIHTFIAREVVMHIGTFTAATAYGFLTMIGAKIAESWFQENQRSTANVIAFVSNPIGASIGMVLPAKFLRADDGFILPNDTWHLFYYNLFVAVLCFVPLLLVLFLRSSRPPTPPSAGSEIHSHSSIGYWSGILICLKRPQYLMQLLLFAVVMSTVLVGAFYQIDVINARGYGVGYYMAGGMVLASAFLSIPVGKYVDRTKNFTLISNILLVSFTVAIILLRLLLIRRCEKGEIWPQFLLGFLLLFSYTAGTALMPLYLEMGIETSFPVLEATSCGLMVILSQIFTVIGSVIVFSVKDSSFLYGKINDKTYNGNWQLTWDLTIIPLVLVTTISVFANRPRYRRMEKEAEEKETFANGKSSI